MIDYTKLIFTSDLNAFKSGEVQTATVTLSGSLAAFEEKTFTASVVLSEAQDFAEAQAEYRDYTQAISGDTTLRWRRVPTNNAGIDSSIGYIPFYIYARINGSAVTFVCGVANPSAGAITLTSTTVNFEYTTSTLNN